MFRPISLSSLLVLYLPILLVPALCLRVSSDMHHSMIGFILAGAISLTPMLVRKMFIPCECDVMYVLVRYAILIGWVDSYLQSQSKIRQEQYRSLTVFFG